MARCPTPIIMLSSLTERNSVTTIKALELGAVDFIAKKSSFVQLDIVKIGDELVDKLRYWAKKRARFAPGGIKSERSRIDTSTPVSQRKTENQGVPGLIVLGISTGGPATLPQTLKAMGKLKCPMVVAQHMPPMFTSGFARHLSTETGLNVVESSDGMEAKPGMVIIIKGGSDAVIREPFPGRIMLYERTNTEANIHPNADVLFRSAATVSCAVVAVVMTGMGRDGMVGAQELVARKACPVLVQSPDSCIVDGMPSSVIEAGLATAILDPTALGARLGRMAGVGAILNASVI
jgi:two-component system chemotaxis response regulator CheB